MSEQPEISLTSFVDYAAAQSLRKIQIARRAKTQQSEPYNPVRDFWRRGRLDAVKYIKMGMPGGFLESHLAKVPARQQASYKLAYEGLARWAAREQPVWIDKPDRQKWCSAGTTVSVNPEMKIRVGVESFVVKLYFRAEPPLGKEGCSLSLRLVDLAQCASIAARPAILDVRRSALITNVVPADIDLLLEAEAAHLAVLWPQLGV